MSIKKRYWRVLNRSVTRFDLLKKQKNITPFQCRKIKREERRQKGRGKRTFSRLLKC